MSERKPKVLVGMSGGVDSSLAAALLLEQGYEVVGAFMKNWSGDAEGPSCADPEKVGQEFSECGWRDERRDAMRVASQLGIPFLTFDFEKEYRERVVEYLFREYAAGRTPNPDVMCNKHMKFDLFLREADKLGCDFVATGHYARHEGDKILMGSDPNKDQTYFLWAMPPAALPRVLFPVGHLPKPEVRRLAAERGLVTAQKKDSTGICFVGEVDMKAFLKARIKEKPGNIVTTEGKVVGRHDSIAFFTIGQRNGLGVGGGPAWYVVGKNAATNELIVSEKEHASLFRQELTATEANWFRMPADGTKVSARVRYRQEAAPCEVRFDGERIRVRFDAPQRAVTPGQSIVFYDGEEMLGGAVIE